MHHYFEAITNTSGASLIGYFARVIDRTTQGTVPIYADDNGTPIITVSGHADMAKTDEYGNLDFYIEPGSYHLDIYAPDATTFRFRVPNVGMNSTKGDTGPAGPPGPAGNVAPDLATLKAASLDNVTMLYDQATFTWTPGDFTGQADDINIIESDNAPLSEGAWKRQGAGAIAFAQDDPDAVFVRVQQQIGAIVRPEQFGATGSGEDELALLQKTLNFAAGRAPVHISRKHYILPPDSSGPRGLVIPSNSRIVFEGAGEIENLAHDLDRYEMLYISAVENVEIINPVLNGRRDLNTSVDGEYGNGIQIIGACKNIRIENPITNNMWGDGIFIGQDLFASPYAVPQDVTINGHKADNCRRQGMSLTGGVNVTISNPRWINTNGTSPSSGLDIEPDRPDSKLLGIRIINPYTANNSGSGILVYFGALRATTMPVDVTIQNHVSEGDLVTGLRCWRSGATDDHAPGAVRYWNGRIVRPYFSGVSIEEWDSRGPQITLSDIEVIDPNESNSLDATARAGIVVFDDVATTVATNIGNVVLRDYSIIDTRVPTRLSKWLYMRNLKGLGRAEKIRVSNPVVLQASNVISSWIDAVGSFFDPAEVTKLLATVDDTLGPDLYATVYSTATAGDTVTLSLSTFFSAGLPDMEFAAEGAQLVLNPDDGSSILPGGSAGKALIISPKGRVKLRRMSSTEWMIVSSVGTLTFEP